MKHMLSLYFVFLLFLHRIAIKLIMSIFPHKLITSLVLFPIVPILLPLETDYDNIFPIYMIWMLLLFYKRASYLAVCIVECSSAMLDPSTLPLGPVEHKPLDLLNVIG
jgi:hypothetical protein